MHQTLNTRPGHRRPLNLFRALLAGAGLLSAGGWACGGSTGFGACLSGPTLIDPATGTVYARTPTRMLWEEARAYAAARNGYLVCFGSAQEEAFVVDHFLLNGLLEPSLWFWLGFTDELKEGDWRWESGEPVVYLNWACDQPSNTTFPHAPGGEDYAAWGATGAGGCGGFAKWRACDQPSGSWVFWGIVEIPPDAPRCYADCNCDRIVNAADLSFLLGSFGASVTNFPGAAAADFNEDGTVNAADLSILLAHFGREC